MQSDELDIQAALVQQAKQGDGAAFRQLCELNRPRLLKMLFCVTKNMEDAEDAFQESALRAYLHLGDFDQRSAFSTWFYRIALNSALMFLRRKRRSSEISVTVKPTDEPFAAELQIPDQQPNPEDYYRTKQTVSLVRAAIHRLPLSYRTVIELHTVRNRSTKEICEELGLSMSTVKSRLARGRKHLKTLIAP